MNFGSWASTAITRGPPQRRHNASQATPFDLALYPPQIPSRFARPLPPLLPSPPKASILEFNEARRIDRNIDDNVFVVVDDDHLLAQAAILVGNEISNLANFAGIACSIEKSLKGYLSARALQSNRAFARDEQTPIAKSRFAPNHACLGE